MLNEVILFKILKMKKTFLFFIASLLFLSAQGQSYRYYKAQMHCHSTNSDCELDSAQVMYEYKNRGYEILFLTDHNYMSQMEGLSQHDFLCINSEELTFDKHMNGFFMNHTIHASGFNPQQAIDSVKAQGGLIQFNHPIVTITGEDWSYSAGEFLALHDLDLIEIHNWGTEFTFAPFNKLIWDSVLSFGRAIWGTATDDMHHLVEVVVPAIDRGWVMIWLSELNKDSVFHALKQGKFYASTGVEVTNYEVHGDTIDFSCTNCDKIKFIGDHGAIRKTVNGSCGQYIRGLDNYIRITAEGSAGLFGTETTYAFTQPHFFNFPFSEAENVLSAKKPLKLYPNPVSDNGIIELTMPEKGA